MAGSEFVNSTMTLTSISGWWWRYNGAGNVLLTLIGTLYTNQALFECHSLSECCCWSCASIYGNNYMSQSHLKQVPWPWRWPFQSPDLNPIDVVELWCGDFEHEGIADKSAAVIWCNHVNLNQNPKEKFSTPWWISHEDYFSSLRAKLGFIQCYYNAPGECLSGKHSFYFICMYLPI